MLFGKSINGNSRKAKPFSFTPRYYDADKEEMKERYARIESELSGNRSLAGSDRFSLRDKWQQNKKTRNFEKKSSTRLVFIVIILFALSYWMFYY